MELVISFVSGFLLSAAAAFFIARGVLLRTEKAHRAALDAADASSKAALQAAKASHETALQAAQDAHKAAQEAIQLRFDETLAKVTAQLRCETGEMLKQRQEEFSQTSRDNIGSIVTPLRENIAQLRKALEDEGKQQAERSGELRERLKTLIQHSDAARHSADALASALRHGSKVQGDWGETVLEELLSAQGLTKGIHFDTQATIVDAEGRPLRNPDGGIMRPDVILHLDEKREVIIDSKVSLTAYVDYVNAENEQDRRTFLKAHIESLRKHVRELSAKDYSSYIKSPRVGAGYVIMFVPSIGAMWTALQAEPDLWRRAADMNVYIADEQSLYGALKIVSRTWTLVAQAQNHEKVYALAAEMIDRVGQFMDHYESLGRALEKVDGEYQDCLRKLSPQGQSIINTSNKLLKLGARNSERHPIKIKET